MIDLTKFGVTKGPWIYEWSDSVEGFQHFVCHPGTSCNETTIAEARYGLADGKVLAASYEMLEALINQALVYAERWNITIIEKATGLPWAEVKQRLGV